MNTISLIVGDWSGDGHNMTDTIVIKTNYTTNQIREAFEKNSKDLKFNLLDYCLKFEESTIDKSILDSVLEKLNVTTENLNLNDDYKDYCFDSDSYARLYLAIVEHNNPDFNYQIINSDYSVNIGGYGLFYL